MTDANTSAPTARRWMFQVQDSPLSQPQVLNAEGEAEYCAPYDATLEQATHELARRVSQWEARTGRQASRVELIQVGRETFQ